jgi:hypothetical protein
MIAHKTHQKFLIIFFVNLEKFVKIILMLEGFRVFKNRVKIFG